jgi:threonine/homoserine/homoserine lactone efflux protein
MAGTDVLLTFLLTAATILAWIAGPAMLYAAARTLAGGRRAGLMASLGIHLGGYAHVLAATAGLSVLFHAVPAVYLAVKLAGAGYLVWLGATMLFGGRAEAAAESAAQAPAAAFRQSVLVEMLNPKTAIFFLSLLPQFVDPAAALPVWGQFLILGVAVNLMFSSADLVAVAFAARLSSGLRSSPAAQLWMRRIGGGVLVGLGARLAAERG